jgi:hypothetical protein
MLENMLGTGLLRHLRRKMSLSVGADILPIAIKMQPLRP